MRKLYAYVDETGQETEGDFFLVSTIIVGNEKDVLLAELETIEKQTGKRDQSWRQTRFESRLAYVDRVLYNAGLRGKIFFAVHRETKEYPAATRATIIRALDTMAPDRNYKVTVVIDGLHRPDRNIVAVELRQSGIRVKKVRSSRDESNALARLADAMAGFIRDAQEGAATVAERLASALERNWIREAL